MFSKFSRVFVMLSLLIAPMAAMADDTDIFGTSSSRVPPNVMIIFDTSSTMSQLAPSVTYNPATTYAGTYTTAAVYVKKVAGNNVTWDSFAAGVASLGCAAARDVLNRDGIWVGLIDRKSPFGCSTSPNDSRTLATGNYLNFFYNLPASDTRTRLAIAQEAVNILLASYNESAVRFGLMRFNPLSEHDRMGGWVVSGIGQHTTEQKIAIVNALTIDDNNLDATPLAETLTEAGLYFAGLPSWANPGTYYTSPIQWRCQQNYVVLMTDGQSSFDDGNGLGDNLFTKPSLFGLTIANYDPSPLDSANFPDHGSHWLDNVAKFLFETDLIRSGTDAAGESFQDPNFLKQSIVTYIIGFATGTDTTLLERAVNDEHGNGKFLRAQNSEELKIAFLNILSDILARNSNGS